jgi:hypothetical protein
LDEIQESNGISNQYGFHLKNNIWNWCNKNQNQIIW